MLSPPHTTLHYTTPHYTHCVTILRRGAEEAIWVLGCTNYLYSIFVSCSVVTMRVCKLQCGAWSQTISHCKLASKYTRYGMQGKPQMTPSARSCSETRPVGIFVCRTDLSLTKHSMTHQQFTLRSRLLIASTHSWKET